MHVDDVIHPIKLHESYHIVQKIENKETGHLSKMLELTAIDTRAG